MLVSQRIDAEQDEGSVNSKTSKAKCGDSEPIFGLPSDPGRLVNFEGFMQAKTPEERFIWMINNQMLPGPTHQLRAAREMNLDMRKVPWDKLERPEDVPSPRDEASITADSV